MSDIHDDFQIFGRVGDSVGFSVDDNNIGKNLSADTEGQFRIQPHRSFLINGSGRFYDYADKRWVTDSDDNFGGNIENMNESGGTGANPLVEWEHMGILIPSGTLIRKLHMIGRTNNNDVTDQEFSLILRRPNPITRYQTGFDNDAEIETIEIYRGLWRDMVEGSTGTPFSGNMNDRHGAIVDINFFLKGNAELSIYSRPVGTNTATRYFTHSYTWEMA